MKPSYLKTFFIIFFICLAMLIVRYEGYGLGDMNDHMALAYHDASPEVLKNDWFVKSASGFNVRKGFGFIVNSIDSLIGNYEISCIILLFVSMVVFSIGFYKIIFLLTKNHKLSLFSIIFPFIIYKEGIGGQAINLGNFILASRISLPFIIFALYFYLKKRYFLGFLLLGFMSLIHISQSYLIYGVLVVALILKRDSAKSKWLSKGELKNKGMKILKSLSFFIFFSLSAILLFRDNINPGAISQESILYIFGKFRAPWHLSIFTWPFPFWFWSALFFILFLVGYKYSGVNKEHKSIFKNFVIIIFAYFVLGFIFTEIIPTVFAVKIGFYRAYEFLNIVEFIFISELFYTCILKVKEYLGGFWRSGEEEKGFTAIAIILIGMMVLVNFLLIIFYVSPTLFNRILQTLPLIVLTLFLFLIFFADKKKRKILLIIILVSGLFVYLLYNPLIDRYKEGQETEEMYSFIKGEIPRDAIILIPPQMTTFRVGTERAIVVDFKTFPFSDKSMIEWYERILDITKSQDEKYENNFAFVGGNGMKDLKKGYESLSEEDILFLKEKYKMDYGVFEKPKDLDFQIIYENEKFIIYKV